MRYHYFQKSLMCLFIQKSLVNCSYSGSGGLCDPALSWFK